MEVPSAPSKLGGGQTTFTIHFETNGGSVIADASIESGAQLTAPAVPEKAGNSFIGWYTDNYFFNSLYDFSGPVSASFTLYAKWQPIDYIISYELDQEYGSEIELPEDPSRIGYTFGGWYLDTAFENEFDMETMPAEDLMVYAKWVRNTYTMTFMAMDAVYSIKVDYFNAPITPPAIPNGDNGYIFGGWEKDGEAYILSYMPAEDITLYAAWDTIDYTITYYLDGGDNSQNNPSIYDVETATITLESATKYGNVFLGWYNNAEFSGNAVTAITTGSYGDISLYAKWALEQYSITYNLNGGINAEENPSEYNIEDEITFAPATREGYVFFGWYSDSGLTQAISGIALNSIGTVEIFASWKADLTAYNQALNGVSEEDYTETSWDNYQIIVAENIVDEDDTAESVAVAVENILNAQNTILVLLTDVSVTGNLHIIGANVKLTNPETEEGFIFRSEDGVISAIPNDIAIASEFDFYDLTSTNNYMYTLNNLFQWLSCGKLLAAENLSDNAAMLKSITITYDNGTAVNVYDAGKAYIYDSKLFCGVSGLDGAALTVGTTTLQPQGAADNADKMTLELATHVLSNEAGTYDFDVVMEWEEIVYGTISRDPGNTGGELETLIEGDDITFSGEIDWYPQEGGRARGNRVGVQITAPTGFDATGAQVIIGENTYTTLFDGKDYFWWYPLVTTAGQTFTAEVTWNSSSVQTFSVIIDEDSTLQAALNEVLFNKNNANATGEMSAQQIRQGSTNALSTNAFERVGYSFAGWATEASGEVVYLDGADYTMGAQPTNTLYAVWSINTYTITYNLNYNYDEEMDLLNPVREGYDFAGWYLEPEFLTQYDAETMPMQNITLYAKWVVITNLLATKYNELNDGDYNAAFPNNSLSYAEGAGEETYFTYTFYNDYIDLLVSVLYLQELAYCFNFISAEDTADFCSDLQNTLPEGFDIYVDGKYVYCATEIGYDILNRDLIYNNDFYYLERAESLTVVSVSNYGIINSLIQLSLKKTASCTKSKFAIMMYKKRVRKMKI